MAVITAFAAQSALGGVSNPHLAVDMDTFAAELWPPHVSFIDSRAIVSLTAHHPVSQEPRTISAFPSQSFFDDFYHRIHVSPREISMGNILSTQSGTVSFWNAHLEPREILSISGLVDGMVLDGEEAPYEVVPLGEISYEISIGQEGAASVDTRLEWTFDNDEIPSVHVTASRIFIWGFLPDWGDDIVEQLEWNTEILTSKSLVEQRRSWRISPRRSFTAQLYVEDRERQLLDLALFDWSARVWGLPIWPDVQVLSQNLALGAMRINCATQHLDFRVGGLAILHSGSAFEYEGIVVLAIDANGIDLAGPLQRAWPPGTRLYPGRTAQLTQEPNQSRIHDRATSIECDFLIMEVSDWPAVLPTTVYRGYAVLDARPDESEDLTEQQVRLMAMLDTGYSLPLSTDVAKVALKVRGWNWVGYGRQERATFRSLLYALHGRRVPVWLPTHADDLTVIANIGSTTMDVAYCGYTRFGHLAPGRRDVRIELFNGTVFYRRITGSVELSSSVERLQIDSALGVAVTPEQIMRVSWMALSRLSSDKVKISHVTDSEGEANSKLTLRQVRDDAI